MSKKWQIIILLSLGLLTRFAFFGRPDETVFDEVHFGKFVSAYYTGEYYFDIHPPLGKLTIAGFAKLFDFEPQYSFVNIGDKFPDRKYLSLRFLPAMAGTFLPLIIYLLALELSLSRIAALIAGLLIIFDNALLTQSRLILLDPFLLLFGFASLLFYFKKKYLLMAVSAGLAISIKWTGLSFIALPVLIEAAKNLKSPKTDIKLAIASFISVFKFASLFIISLIIYFSVFVLHFALLPKPGPGDAFMKPNFRESNIVKNIANLNIEMYKSNQRISASHPYSSRWYAWPFMTRPIYYWVKDNARIYFLGNPVIWWSSTIAVVAGLWTMAYGLWLKFKEHKLSSIVSGPLALLLVGYWLNLLPFIGVKRVMFLYHYLTALIFAVLMLCYLIDRNHFDELKVRNNSRKIFTGIMVAVIAVFLFFAPLSYGLPLSDKAYSARIWFASWR